MNPNDFADPLTFPLTQVRYFVYPVKYLNIYSMDWHNILVLSIHGSQLMNPNNISSSTSLRLTSVFFRELSQEQADGLP